MIPKGMQLSMSEGNGHLTTTQPQTYTSIHKY